MSGVARPYRQTKAPRLKLPFQSGRRYWRRPTFAQPIEALSSGLQRFTSVFGMGTGGSTALRSPEGRLLLLESTINVDLPTSTGDSGYHWGVPSREPLVWLSKEQFPGETPNGAACSLTAAYMGEVGSNPTWEHPILRSLV